MTVSERMQLPPVVTGSSWANVFGSLFMASKRGKPIASDGTVTPRLTNREAIALTSAWRAVAPMTQRGWPLWYQFQAAAYDWSPSQDAFDVSATQADKLYPIELTNDLWQSIHKLSLDLDDERSNVPASVDLDAGSFDDLLVQGDVKRALLDDGGLVKFTPIDPAIQDKKFWQDLLDGFKETEKRRRKVTDDIVKTINKGLPRPPDLLTVAAILAAIVVAYKVTKGLSSRHRRKR